MRVCDDCVPPDYSRLNRREFLGIAGVGVPALFAVRRSVVPAPAPEVALKPVEVAPGLKIHRRDEWGKSLKPRRKMKPEKDVKFLLVHHSAGSTFYSREQVKQQLQIVYGIHTGVNKRWPDVCYNFFVDRFGGVWEGRKGSLDGAVVADATGGSQGFAQLVCLLGNYEEEKPSKEMMDSLAKLLGWLGHRHQIDLHQNHRVRFVSRGSDKWRKGVRVTGRPISGHRDMSYTTCPGTNVYRLLEASVPKAARTFQKTLEVV